MKTQAETLESTKAELPSFDELDIHRLQRWMDKERRLFVVYDFGYGTDPAKPHLGDFEKISVRLLDVHGQKINEVPIGRFHYNVINGLLMPWREIQAFTPVATVSVFLKTVGGPAHPEITINQSIT